MRGLIPNRGANTYFTILSKSDVLYVYICMYYTYVYILPLCDTRPSTRCAEENSIAIRRLFNATLHYARKDRSYVEPCVNESALLQSQFLTKEYSEHAVRRMLY